MRANRGAPFAWYFLTFSRPKKLCIWSGYSLSICVSPVHFFKTTEILEKVLPKCCYTLSVLEVFCVFCFPDPPSVTPPHTAHRTPPHAPSCPGADPGTRAKKTIPLRGGCAFHPSLQWLYIHIHWPFLGIQLTDSNIVLACSLWIPSCARPLHCSEGNGEGPAFPYQAFYANIANSRQLQITRFSSW